MPKKYYIPIVTGLLILMLFFEISSVLNESQTIDEGTHLAAGFSYLMKNDYRMNLEHPPLLKELAALPLVLINHKLKTPFNYDSWREGNQWQFAKDFIYDNNISADTILFLGRIPTMILSLILGIFIFKWSKQLFGLKSAILALFLYCLSPNILAHSRYITTDIGVALFFFLTIYYFYKYLKSPIKKNLILTGIFFSFALASKFSAFILLPILIILYLIKKIKDNKNIKLFKLIRNFIFTFTVIIIIAGIIVSAVYGFEIKKPIDDEDVKSLYDRQEQIINNNQIDEQNELTKKIINLTDTRKRSGQIIKSFAETIPIPAFSYLNGAVKVFLHNYHGHQAYLLNKYSNYGWWYYFPVAFLAKTPLTTLLLLLLTIAFGLYLCVKNKIFNKPAKYLFQKIPIYVFCLILPPLIYFGFSLSSHINLGIRHILIIYPFIFIIISWLIKVKIFNKTMRFSIIGILLIIYAFSSLAIYPYYLAYFNEAAGGPANGPKYLVDSNIDWGQDAKRLKKYMNDNNIPYVCLSYFGQAKLEYYDIDYRYLPNSSNFKGTSQLNCVVAISVTSLFSKERPYEWLFSYEPNDKIGYSIYIYDFRQ